MLRPWTPATIALLLSLSQCTFGPSRAETVPSEATARRARGAPDGAPRSASQQTVDQVIAGRIRGAIRADPFLARAMQTVKVTSDRGVVRLVGQVSTHKERSSIAFKAGQAAGFGRVDDRLTIGNGVEEAAW